MDRILVIEDHQSTKRGLVSILRNLGFCVDDADDGLEGESMITGNRYDLILVDLMLPKMNGLELLKRVKEISPDTEVVVFTGHQTIDSAINAMKLGAYDYLIKPLEPQKIISTIHQAIERKSFVKISTQHIDPLVNHPCLLGRSRQMVEIFKLLAKITDTETPILITGEIGTGKKTLARTIHQNSPFRSFPFIMINCSAIPDNLSEEQAFSYLHERIVDDGQKDGQKNTRCTLYLANIDMAPLSIQLSLRYFLDHLLPSAQSNDPFTGDVRLITSSRRNLTRLVEKNLLREDLFFRINTFPIYMPPLRERKVDIPLLASHFSNKYAISPTKSLSPEVLALFMKYQWPGNIQELKKVIDYAVLMSTRHQISLEDLPNYLKNDEGSSFSHMIREKDLTLEEVEKIVILEQLNMYGWDQKKTASHLGIGRTTLWRRLKQYGISSPHVKRLEG